MGGYGADGLASCEFFFPLRDCPDHKGVYPVFGRVLEGMDEIYRLEKVKTVPVDFPIPGVEVNGARGTRNHRSRRTGPPRPDLPGADPHESAEPAALLEEKTVIRKVLCREMEGFFTWCAMSEKTKIILKNCRISIFLRMRVFPLIPKKRCGIFNEKFNS